LTVFAAKTTVSAAGRAVTVAEVEFVPAELAEMVAVTLWLTVWVATVNVVVVCPFGMVTDAGTVMPG
jgi:hypothetical protein